MHRIEVYFSSHMRFFFFKISAARSFITYKIAIRYKKARNSKDISYTVFTTTLAFPLEKDLW